MAKGEFGDLSVIKPYAYQVAGHSNEDALKLTSDGLILKPVQRPPKGEQEVVFYDAVFSNKEDRGDILQLRKFLPQYYGTVQLTLEGRVSRFLCLEDVTRKFTLPCVLDIKIGRVTWEDNVDENFKERRRKKWPIQGTAGFGVLGFLIYNHTTQSYEKHNSEWSRTLHTLEEVKQKTFVKYIHGVSKELRSTVLEGIIGKLMEIKKWFLTQRVFRFIASSILIAYDGHRTSGSSDNEATEYKTCAADHQPQSRTDLENDWAEARMIDMAHVFETSDVDENYLFGLNNVISLFEQLKSEL